MKLTLLGTGSFFIEKNKSASSFLLEVAGKKILIDCGPGTLLRLAEHGLHPEELDYILITHFHADHTSDLYPLLMRCSLGELFKLEGYTRFPQLFGPVGLDEFMLTCAKNLRLPMYEKWDKMKAQEITATQVLDTIKVTPYPVKHWVMGVDSGAQAYRIEAEGKTIVFSGDTEICEGIVEAAKGADLFICDCALSAGSGGKAHVESTQVGEICAKAGVVKVILTHIYPQTEKVDVVAEVRKNFAGEIIKGEDGMEIEI